MIRSKYAAEGGGTLPVVLTWFFVAGWRPANGQTNLRFGRTQEPDSDVIIIILIIVIVVIYKPSISLRASEAPPTFYYRPLAVQKRPVGHLFFF